MPPSMHASLHACMHALHACGFMYACLDTVGTPDKIAFVAAKRSTLKDRPLELIPFIPHSSANDTHSAESTRMKCQQCDRPATFHITDLVDGKPDEVHLCEACAQSFLAPSGDEAAEVMPAMAGLLAQQLAVGETADQLARLDERACPVCGITFLEFRKQGRLGCPHDYVFFAEELEPLLLNIHDETHHIGKVPKRCSSGADQPSQEKKPA